MKGTITITRGPATATDANKQLDESNKAVIFKYFTPFRACISKINNTQVDNAKDLDVMMSMYNLIEYSNNYSKTSRNLWQYYRNEPQGTTGNSESFKSMMRITGKSPAGSNTKDVEIAVPLKYLGNF